MMRYRELVESRRPWKTYRGRKHRCRLVRTDELLGPNCKVVEVEAVFGSVFTGRQDVHHGYFVSLMLPTGEVIGYHPRWLYDALRDASEKAQDEGWTVLAIGRTPQFKETGLSTNSGFGIHPAYPDRAVHMLEPPPTKDD
jgi:hypothetical protein